MGLSHVRLDPEDAFELAELLEDVGRWVGCSHGSVSWERFTGLGFSPAEFQDEIARFVFLLGGTAAGLSWPGEQQ
jgi:hypothetical protein